MGFRTGGRGAGARGVRQLTREVSSHFDGSKVDRRNRRTNGGNDNHPPCGHHDNLAAKTVDDVGLAIVAVSHQ